MTLDDTNGRRVLLLRTPDEDVPDRFEAELGARGYVTLTVPVLETVLENVDVLRERIERGPSTGDGGRVDGVVLTSKRSTEAWREAVRMISEDGDRDREADWRSVPFYAVGEATAGAARKIGEAFPELGELVPVDVRLPEASGTESNARTAKGLAEFILRDVGGAGRKLLYLTGDKNREDLPKELDKGDVELDALRVYRTSGSSTFGADLKDVLEKAGGESNKDWGWVVYFAPSSAAFVTPFLRDAFRLRAQHPSNDALTGKPTVNIAAIGPTTASSLRDMLELRVDVTAPKPLPAALANAIVAFDGP